MGQLWGQQGNPERELPPHAADRYRRSLRQAAGQDREALRQRGGLYLEVNPAGGKWWRWKYRYGGKEKRLSLGVYPDVSLKGAREKRDAARQQLAAGIDPGQARRAEKLAQAGAESFEAVAREWHVKFSPGWVASHGDRILKRLEKDLFPWLGKRPIAEIKAPELLAVLRRIESRGAQETAHRAMQNCVQVFRYAVATGRAERDPTGDLRGALPAPKEKHHASIIEPKRNQASCCGQSTPTKDSSPPSARYGSRPSCSSGPVNCARHSGPKSTSTKQNGESPPSA